MRITNPTVIKWESITSEIIFCGGDVKDNEKLTLLYLGMFRIK